jgi:methyltransferase-like protein 6
MPDERPKKVIMEIGCGVGNSMFPLLQVNPDLYFYALDFSPRAIAFVKVRLRFMRTFSVRQLS